jgi:serine kinase of HPr protein (carbohydrate metabolism regulator)
MAEIHAGCVVIGEAGVLIRGPSGSGKTCLARRLIAAAKARGLFARLVADDRVALSLAGGRLSGRPNRAIAGKMEVRGLGIVAAPHEDAAVIRLVADCVTDTPPRLPEDAVRTVIIDGVALPRVISRHGSSEPVWIMLGLGDLTIQDE